MKPLKSAQLQYVKDNMCVVDGAVVWKTTAFRRKAGDFCGWVDDAGYQRIQIAKGVLRRGHQIAYFLHTGEWPSSHIDHIDGNRLNNRVENLRVVDGFGNAQNAVSSKNKFGFQGVSKARNGKFKSEISAHGRRRHLGCFNTPEEAFQAYKRASLKLHGDHSPFRREELAA